jgi:DNA mismatch repair protein MutH
MNTDLEFLIVRLIGNKMLKADIAEELVSKMIELSARYVGFVDLMILWDRETNEEERALIIKDLEELISDIELGEKK